MDVSACSLRRGFRSPPSRLTRHSAVCSTDDLALGVPSRSVESPTRSSSPKVLALYVLGRCVGHRHGVESETIFDQATLSRTGTGQLDRSRQANDVTLAGRIHEFHTRVSHRRRSQMTRCPSLFLS